MSWALPVDLRGWDTATFENANIFGVLHPPPGFVEHALASDAVQVGPDK